MTTHRSQFKSDREFVEDRAADEIRRAFKQIGDLPSGLLALSLQRFPWFSQDVLTAMECFGYVASEELLHCFLAAGELSEPEKDLQGRFQWSALHVASIWRWLEARRMWQPGHPAHQWKKPPIQLELEQYGPDSMPDHLRAILHRDMRDLAITMATNEDRVFRENILSAMLYKMALEA